MTAPRVGPDTPFFVIHNLGSGHADGDATRERIEQRFAAAGRPLRLVGIDRPQRLPQIARETVAEARAGGGVVVAAGGDGTVNAVAQAVLGSGCAFGVLPRGTFNYFSRSHGIPVDTDAALELLLTARPQAVQAGLINERVFLVNASLGLYPKLLEDREAYKAQFGRSRLVAFGAGLATLLREHRQLRIRLEQDGRARDIRTPTLFVGNNRLQLEQIGIDEAPRVEAGELVAITLRPIGTLAMLGLLLRGAFGQLGEADQVFSFGLRQMTVRPRSAYRRRVKVATDGEVAWLKTPLEFRVAPEPLWLLKPDAEEGSSR